MSRAALPQHALAAWLPADREALSLEARGLWRRAAARWQQLMLRTPDALTAEALLQRQRACLMRSRVTRVSVSDGTAPSGMSTHDMSGGTDLWRTE